MRDRIRRSLIRDERPVSPLDPEQALESYRRDEEAQAAFLRTYILGGIIICAAFGLAFISLGDIRAFVNLGGAAGSVAVLVVALFRQRAGDPTTAGILALLGPMVAPVTFAWVFSSFTGVVTLLLAMPLAAFALLPPEPRFLRPGMAVFGMSVAVITRYAFQDGWALAPLPGATLKIISAATFAIAAVSLGALAVVVQRRLAVKDELAARVFAHADLLASTDHLTGLPNRRPVMAKLEKELAEGGSVVVALADLDRFKDFNDTHGHHCGDEVLMSVARRLAEGVRGRDMVARWGGEEFLIVLSGAEQHEAVRVLDRLRFGVEQRVTHCAGHGHSVTITLGVAQCDSVEDLDDALRRADVALYAAKEAGRNRVVHAA